MRSRNGNYRFSLSVYPIIFFSSLALNASEYLISYRYVVKDAVLHNESLYISQTMKKCYGTPQNAIEFASYNSTNLKEILSKNSQEFIDYMHKLGIQVEHKDITRNARSQSTTILTLKTTCFKVEFNDNFAKIAPLK